MRNRSDPAGHVLADRLFGAAHHFDGRLPESHQSHISVERVLSAAHNQAAILNLQCLDEANENRRKKIV